MKYSLAEKRPDLLDEWDYQRNADITPETISYGSAKKVCWVCRECGNTWQDSVNHRTNRNSGCPECAKKNRGASKTASCAKKNNLQTNRPDIAKEWHPIKNGSLTPSSVSVSSNKKVWWLCPVCGRDYPATVNHRTLGGTGCPHCAAQERGARYSKNAAAKNNLAVYYPQLVEEWDYTENGDLKPEDVATGSNYVVGWVCSFCGHKWKKSVIKRTQGYGCPNCTKAGTSFSELAILFYLKQAFPEILHRHIISDFEFDLYIPSSRTAIEYDGVFYHNSAHALDKENAKDAFCEAEGIRLIRIRDPKLPDTVSAYRITCVDEQKNHLETAIKDLLAILCPDVQIAIDVVRDTPRIYSAYRNTIKEKSIAVTNPELIAQWHPTKNLPLTPERVTSGMHVKVWWHCSNCGQDYPQDIYHKVQGRGCPICAGKTVIAGYNDLATTHPTLSAQFHPTKNGDLLPMQITAGSSKKIWWLCDKCGWEWPAAPSTRKKRVGCPRCARTGRKEKMTSSR